MEIEIFTIADFACDYGTGKLSVIGTFDHIFSQNFPTVHPACALAARIRLANSEAGSHNLELIFRGPDNREFIERIKSQMNFQVNPAADYATLNLVMNLNNIKFEKPGKYAIELYFDGEFRSGLHLNLIQGLPQGMPSAA